MKRSLLLSLLALTFSASQAQTMFRVTNVSVTEKGVAKPGRDVSAEVKGSEGDDRLVMYDQDGLRVKAQVRIRTHDSNRSSIKESAVYATFEIRLKVDGEDDRRTIQKVFYGEDARKTHLQEKFTIKKGINVRVITVEFDGSLE